MAVSQAIRANAERILSTDNGAFERSVGPPLIKKITDGLLVHIKELVSDVGAAAQPKLSGLACKRLMIWVLIDLLRSPMELHKAAADKLGGRIWVQAQRVSIALLAVADGAAKQRTAARTAAATDSNLEAGLAMKLAAIDAAEQMKLDLLWFDVYEGMDIELEVIISPPPVPVGAAAPTAVTPLPNLATPVTACDGVRYPHLLPRALDAPRETPAIPPDLLASLDPDGVQSLFNECSSHMEGADPELWWSWCLPHLVNSLTRQLAASASMVTALEGEMERRRVLSLSLTTAQRALLDQQQVVIDAVHEENEELREKLTRAEAQTEVLAAVLSRKNA